MTSSAIERLVDATINEWPEHARFINSALSERCSGLMSLTNNLAELVERLAGNDLTDVVKGYRWMCEMIVEEEWHFRRTGKYRFSSFEEANLAIYQKSTLMQQYMAGLLLSQVLWTNHVSSLDFYLNEFIPGNKSGYRHLEIGPGHGFLLYFAAADARCHSLSAMDVSPASLHRTIECMKALGIERTLDFEERDITASSSKCNEYDSIVLSEVVEHLECPRMALANIRKMLSDDGRVFVNVPVNAPAIDHIYLLSSPEEAVELVESSGFRIEQVRLSPTSGYTEKRARRCKVSISVGIIGSAS